MIAAWISPDVVFQFLINSYGAIALFVYLAIAVAQVRMRRKLERTEPERLTLKMWLFPWLSWVTIALMAVVIGAMAFLPDSRSQFWLSLLTVAVVLTGYELRRRNGPAAGPPRPQNAGAEDSEEEETEPRKRTTSSSDV